MWRYTISSWNHSKLMTFKERAGSLFPSLMIIACIYLLFIPGHLAINTMSLNWKSWSFSSSTCFRLSLNYLFFKLHFNRGVKELSVYWYEHRILLKHAIFSHLNYMHLNLPANYHKPRKNYILISMVTREVNSRNKTQSFKIKVTCPFIGNSKLGKTL